MRYVTGSVLVVFVVLACFAAKNGESFAGQDVAPPTIRMILEDGEVILHMERNPASLDLLSILPFESEFTDYNKTEKVSSLPRRLVTRGAPASMKPRTGDFAYYGPWGNLAVFYRDFRHSEGLVPLGRVVHGLELLEKQTGQFRARLERSE